MATTGSANTVPTSAPRHDISLSLPLRWRRLFDANRRTPRQSKWALCQQGGPEFGAAPCSVGPARTKAIAIDFAAGARMQAFFKLRSNL